ncbi:unnamed protein product [Paramecium octaurelia]|uniref:Uncharacterized protein n=1 Tax=Paramecium octaurelia TaxID=43137 RepID=A0A8S1YN67_PAROT|nr:unnamed protein product [Paramecium octaurelia]
MIHGYEFVKNNSFLVCGDQIVTKEEDCDLQLDGFFQQMYFCSENCYDCSQVMQISLKLIKNSFYLILKIYPKISINIMFRMQLLILILILNQFKEQFNYEDGLIQGGMLKQKDVRIVQLNKIGNDSPSQCIFVKAPSQIINYLNMTQNRQYLSVIFYLISKNIKINPYQKPQKFELSDLNATCKLYRMMDHTQALENIFSKQKFSNQQILGQFLKLQQIRKFLLINRNILPNYITFQSQNEFSLVQ